MRRCCDERRWTILPLWLAVCSMAVAQDAWAQAQMGLGLAARYPHDRQIESDPNVIFTADFESDAWRLDFFMATRPTVNVVADDHLSIDNVVVAKQHIGPVAYEADVVVYGGTSAGVIAAVQAVRMGRSVVIVCPDKHLGGLSSGGLGWTDTGRKEVIGGLARWFYHRIWQHYQQDDAWQWQDRSEYGNRGQGMPAIDGAERTMWVFEPHVAERVFEDLVAEHHIPVYRDEWLDRERGVQKAGGRIHSMSMLSGKTFCGRMFIDATYEGDLMASAGVSHHVGCDPIGIKGQGDGRIQAYCFRMCLTNVLENRVPFPRPDDYDPAQYELLLRVFDTGWRETFDKFDPVPNHKTDTNNHGPFSTDNGHWPHQLYIRKSRRMIGLYVMTENDVLCKRPVPQPVGMGSYAMDSHNVQRYVTADGLVQNEGDIGVSPPEPDRIAYGALCPKKDESIGWASAHAVSAAWAQAHPTRSGKNRHKYHDFRPDMQYERADCLFVGQVRKPCYALEIGTAEARRSCWRETTTNSRSVAGKSPRRRSRKRSSSASGPRAVRRAVRPRSWRRMMAAKEQRPSPENRRALSGGFRLEPSANGWLVGRFGALEEVGVPHLVTTRQGPDVERVRHDTHAASREVAQFLGLDDAAFLEQVHGGDVLTCDGPGRVGRADGLVTARASLALLGKSADCPIVLIADRQRRAVGFAHASWRATVAGVVPAVVRTMTEFGCVADDLVACICPSAGPECYEVGQEVRMAAVERLGRHARAFFHPGPNGKDHFDLWAANRDALVRVGVPSSSIHTAGVCTLCRNDVFPSHRREGEKAGRFAAAIGILPSR